MTRVESMSVPSQSKMTRSYALTPPDCLSAFIGLHPRLHRTCLAGNVPASEFGQLARQRRLDANRLAREGMREGERVRVQEHALQPLLAQPLVELEVAVLVVSEHGVAQVGEMHADLMGAAGEQFGLEEREFGAAREPAEYRFGILAGVRHRHPLLAFGRGALGEREADSLQRITE